jgi:hypothetical protein
MLSLRELREHERLLIGKRNRVNFLLWLESTAQAALSNAFGGEAMARISRFILVISLLSLVAAAQEVDQLKKCVAFVFGRVHVKAPDGSLAKGPDGQLVTLEMPLGTAFFVSYPDKRGGDEYSFGYIVTAKHVLKDVDGSYLKSVKLRVNLVKPQTDSDLTFGDIAVSDDAGRLLWFEDKEDPQNDVAIVPGMPSQGLVDFKTVPIQMFTDAELLKKRTVEEGDSVYLLGLMPQYYGERRNYPVVRRGTLALMTDEPIQTGPDTRQHAYLAELASWPGNSGAPVFLNLGGLRGGSLIGGSDFHLLGLMLGYFSNVRRADVVDTRTIMGGDPSNIGISFVLPASTIRKVLDSAPLQQMRDGAINALPPRPKPR